MGVISAIGNNVEENRTSLIQGKTGIGKAQFLNSAYAQSHPFGEVKLSNDELRSALGVENENHLTRTDLLAYTAFNEAVKSAGLTQEELTSFDTGFLSASTVGGMVETDALYSDANKQGVASPFVHAYACGSHVEHMTRHYGMRGYTTCFNTACSSSANAIMLGARLMKSGRVKRAIVGGTDALAKFAVNGFNSLQILTTKPCRPFDKNREGLTIGEGAAYLVLEWEDDAKVSSGVELIGYGNSNDAFHASSMSDEAIGVRKAIKDALTSGNISGQDVDFVNTHGTGTENNDRVELTGMKAELDQIPHYTSTKSFTGHTLGAAGGIEAIFTALSLMNNEVYASLRCDNPINEVAPTKEHTSDLDLHVGLSNSFGFAGNCSSLAFKKVKNVH